MKPRRRQRGQALVETALVLPLLALLIFGAIEMARLANVAEALHNACREGAHWSAIPAVGTDGSLPPASDVVSRVVSYAAADGIQLDSSLVVVTQNADQTEGGLTTSFSQVQVTYPFEFTVPLIANLLPPIVLHEQAEMRNETN